MKRFLIWILMLVVLFSICGCNNSATPESELLDVESSFKTEQSKGNEEKEPMRFEEKVLYGLPTVDNENAELRPFPETLEEMLDRLGENGSIAAGYPAGTRESYSDQIATLTDFAVEKVYWGAELPAQIKVKEKYALRTDSAGKMYIEERGYDSSRLANDQAALLFLMPSTGEEGVYQLCFVFIPLPDDYQSYDDAYLTEFLDYFRGVRSVYEYPEQVIVPTEMHGSLINVEYGGTYWPEQNITNEALLEQMKDHLLIQLATEFKLKLWPYGHGQYAANDLPTDNVACFRELSYPPAS